MRSYRQSILIIYRKLLLLSLVLMPLKTNAQEYIIGADLSFLKSAEDRGFTFKENNSDFNFFNHGGH
jgi:arabinogalactan endo-1,4-beta-galactosidase